MGNTQVACDFSAGSYQCRQDGYMWDADSDGYDPEDLSYPCPCCNTLVYLQKAKEEAETTESHSGYWGVHTGADIWTNSVDLARSANPAGVDAALQTVGVVEALVPGPDEFNVVVMNDQWSKDKSGLPN